jgi:hypothetical protein
MPSTSLLTNIIFIYYIFIISTLNIENFKKKRRKEEMNQKIKSKLQSSDKGSFYNYLLLGILGIFCAVFYITTLYIHY